MQKYFLKQKDKMTFINAGLLILALLSHFVLKNVEIEGVLLISAAIIGLIPIAIQAFQALRIHFISIDLLVTIAVVGAFFIKNYEEAAVVVFLFLFGAYLEKITLRKTGTALNKLVSMIPETVLLKTENGDFIEKDIKSVAEGDILLVKTGSKLPVDGTILNGQGYTNEANITGESLPQRKRKGAEVFAGTLLENGTLQVQADKVGEATTFGQIIELVEEAQDSKSQGEKIIDRFSKYYTPVILILSLFVWIFSHNLELAITILVLGCPGALVIGVPVSNVSGIGNAAKKGILLKGSEVTSQLSQADTVVFDKTGTLTLGNPEVSEQIIYGEVENSLDYLASVEEESDHPLAKAIVSSIKNYEKLKIEQTEVIKGGGIRAQIKGREVLVGNLRLMENNQVEMSVKIDKDTKALEQRGNSIVLLAIDKKVQLLLGIRDKVRPNARENLQKMRKLGMKELILLSGDNQDTVKLIADELEIKQAYGNMHPEDKATFIKNLQEQSKKVIFVGDGVNDSPSLALADVGVAMGNGTDVAIETSDLVLLNSDLVKLPYALGLSKATTRNMKENIIIAIAVVIFLLLSLIFSHWMNMMIGMLVHEGSILIVILNGMRLLNFSLKNK
ncbi:heavy metal translocating P-type ATPase [Lactococcus garvieae]|uniref:Cd(2+)-exporting ATPase n=1 Tax=Lactococcus garvieae DCC43 TaxID=1231377 RepID=K2PT84_9LACT|nr:heavy metal translocating P-type ATPase [Lactococcus garvieae]EKF50691.1 Lead, cadmium, zinc and mercury transporting ATPase [Lactococcus garvieae DCC43]